MKDILTALVFISAIVIVIASAIVWVHIPHQFFTETQYFNYICFIPKVVFIIFIFTVYAAPAIIAFMDIQNTWLNRLILVPVWIVISAFVSMVSVYSFSGLFAYQFTQNHGVQFKQVYAVSDKEIQVAQRSGEASYELKFKDKSLILPMKIRVNKVTYDYAKLGDEYELNGIESKYGILILDNKKL